MTFDPATLTLAQAREICGNPGKFRDRPTLFELAWAVLKTNRDQPIRQSTLPRSHRTIAPIDPQVTRLRPRLMTEPIAKAPTSPICLGHGPTDGDAA